MKEILFILILGCTPCFNSQDIMLVWPSPYSDGCFGDPIVHTFFSQHGLMEFLTNNAEEVDDNTQLFGLVQDSITWLKIEKQEHGWTENKKIPEKLEIVHKSSFTFGVYAK